MIKYIKNIINKLKIYFLSLKPIKREINLDLIPKEIDLNLNYTEAEIIKIKKLVEKRLNNLAKKEKFFIAANDNLDKYNAKLENKIKNLDQEIMDLNKQIMDFDKEIKNFNETQYNLIAKDILNKKIKKMNDIVNQQNSFLHSVELTKEQIKEKIMELNVSLESLKNELKILEQLEKENDAKLKK